LELFSAAIISPSTTDLYERNLIGFLKRINLSPDACVQLAKHNPSAAEKKIISLISQGRLKIERGEIRKKLPQVMMMHRIHIVRGSCPTHSSCTL
jgi:hypothetical protein